MTSTLTGCFYIKAAMAGLVLPQRVHETAQNNPHRSRNALVYAIHRPRRGPLEASTVRLAYSQLSGMVITLTSSSSRAALPLPGPGNHTGELTYYEPALGACGLTSTGQQHVLAIGQDTFDAAPNNGNPNGCPLCGMHIRISRVQQNGKAVSVKATVVDRCGCRCGFLFDPS
jgi:hypothetical protein